MVAMPNAKGSVWNLARQNSMNNVSVNSSSSNLKPMGQFQPSEPLDPAHGCGALMVGFSDVGTP